MERLVTLEIGSFVTPPIILELQWNLYVVGE
jgi:hypothetical protein